MVKKVEKTKTTRKWRYKSFRDHVDSIKIDPLKDIKRKAFHEVEISHFLSTLDHWKEVNLSKNFQELVEVIEPISMTLPQLLFYKEKIFKSLDTTLSLNDSLSLQPTLELLSQFVHDLGPDFMPFYERSLEIIRDIALAQKDPQSLELIFNTLAYIFKYLSKILSNDLIPTFTTLLPLLTVQKKDYLTRFSSEAISFLIRKANVSSLQSFMDNIFSIEILDSDDASSSSSYHLGLTIMFAESLKSANGVMHSKSGIILPILTKKCIENPKFASVLSDVIMDLLDYNESSQTSETLYNSILNFLNKYLQSDTTMNYNVLTSVVQILFTLSFGESGRKVPSWSKICSLIEPVHNFFLNVKLDDDDDDDDNKGKLEFVNSMASWCSVIVRNADMLTLSKSHILIVKTMSQLDDGSVFLPFIDIVTTLNKERSIQFFRNSIVNFISTHWKENYKQISFFLERLDEKELLDSKYDLNIIISNDFKNFILESFKNISKIENQNALINNYWRLLILKYSKIEFEPSLLIKFLNLLENSKTLLNTDFFILDVYGATIGALLNQKLNDEELSEILLLSFKNFGTFYRSSIFLDNFEKLISHINKSKNVKSIELINEYKHEIILLVSKTLKSSSHALREISLNLIISLFGKSNEEIPDAILKCRTIEQIPLTLQHARDVPLRFRNLAQDYSSESVLTNNIVSNFIFGQLTNKFSPSWQGVQEFTVSVINQISDLVWENSMEFISMDYDNLNENQYLNYEFNELSDTKSDLSNWLPQDSRLNATLNNFELNFHNYELVNKAIIDSSKSKRSTFLHSDFIRYQVIKLLNKIPSVAERNFGDLVPYLVNEDSDDIAEASSTSLLKGWTMADRNGLIELLKNFKNMKKLPSIEKIHSLLLNLLMDKQTELQQLALDVLLNMKNPIYNKYSKHLKNLLDDTLFRDEIIIFLQNNESSKIESNDLPILMPLILRILFGRAQTLKTNSTKTGRKIAAIKSLNNLADNYVIDFLKLTFLKFNYESFYENGNTVDLTEINRKLLKHVNGFINMNLEVTETLGKSHSQCLEVLVEPLLYALSVVETTISNVESFDDNIIEKAARTGRKSGFKLFYQLTQYLGDEFDWTPYGDLIYRNLVHSKMENFGQENLSGVSSLLKIITKLWCIPSRLFFLYMDDYEPVKALLSILPNPNAKDVVLTHILQFISALIKLPAKDAKIIELLSIIISECLESLVLIFENSSNGEVNSLVVEILLLFVSNDYVTDNSNRKVLIDSLTVALDKPGSQIGMNLKIDIVRMISLLVEDYDCTINEILPIYKNVAKLYSSCQQSEMRNVVSTVFYSVSTRFTEFEDVCQLVIDLNAYDSKRFREPDYDRRLKAYSDINETEFKKLSVIEWIPILYTCMFFINDENDQSLRSSASYTFIRYIDGISEKTEDEATEYIAQLKEFIIPLIRSGIKKKNELVRSEYVRVLDHLVANIKYYHEFDDMKILLKYDEEDEESNFFEDIIHLQTFRRQKSLRGIVLVASKLSSNSISHYILPIVEHYAFWTDDKYRNLANETITTVKTLAQFVSWNQFKAILTRYVGIMNATLGKEQKERLRDSILLIVSMSSAMKEWSVEGSDIKPSDYPKIEKIDSFVTLEIIPKLQKVLSFRDEETVTIRVPVSEALILLIMSCSQSKIDSELAGLLTHVCQILRAKSENLRDSVRKHLGRIAIFLGPHYLKFIIKELNSALTRGPQIHILSFTIHYILTVMSPYMEHGSLGDSVDLIMKCIMNDIFGEASEEKEATGYSNKTKEIKHNKSFDTGELIAANIFLKDFNHLLTPVRYLLHERLSLKSQNKLELLMKRFSQGLNKNEESSSTDILVLCKEIFDKANEMIETKKNMKKVVVDEKVERFMVELDARSQKTELEHSLYVTTLQQFSFDLLKTAISKNENLLNPTYLGPFVPMLESSLLSENEGVVISSLRLLTMLVRLDFEKETDEKFTDSANHVLNVLQDMPSTNNEISQNCLKFLSAVIRYKPDLELKDSAISYILKKIEPDLDAPERQGTAFGFLKSITHKHIMIPEIYDCMDTVSRLMVTSTTAEIRAVSRTVFYSFLMEYDQSRGRLEKQFKLIINNLKYPAQAGRLSVMELILTIVKKSSKELLTRLTTSFFIALANVSVTDDSPSCRESASEILGLMFKKIKDNSMDLEFVEKYASVWLSQNKKALLIRCGLNVYKIFINSVGYGVSDTMDKVAFERIEKTLKLANKLSDEENSHDEDDDESNSSVQSDWQLIYSCLNVLENMSIIINIFTNEYRAIWNDIISCMLYPHSWIRLSSSRLIFKLLKALIDENSSEDVEFALDDQTIQNIAYRTFRQLGAPDVSEKLAIQSTANLVYISKKWEREDTKFISDNKPSEDGKPTKVYKDAFDWALNRCAAILKNDSRDYKDLMVTKKAIISYCEFLTTFLSSEKLKDALSETLMIPLLYISEQEIFDDEDEEKALPTLATSCLNKLSKSIGISDYNILLSKAMKTIQQRRVERKTRKAQLTLNNPELAARKKLRKHERIRDKRKNNKDENGFYKAKRRKF